MAFQKKIIICFLFSGLTFSNIFADCINSNIDQEQKTISLLSNQSEKIIRNYCSDNLKKDIFQRLEFAPICRDIKLKKISVDDFKLNNFEKLNCEYALGLPAEIDECSKFIDNELLELILVHKKITNVTQQISENELLNLMMKSFVNRMVLQNRRASGYGKFNAYVFNNLVGLSAGLLYENFEIMGKYAYEVCIEQVYSFLDSPEARYLKYCGLELSKFDETERSDTTGKIKHAFVLIQNKDGKSFVFDTWKGEVTPYIPENYRESKGVDERFKRKKSKYY